MKTARNLTIKVTYTVALGDCKMPDEIYKQLLQVNESSKSIKMGSLEHPEAYEWLIENIDENDCCELKYQIKNIELDKSE
jgi:hypothetical protein